MPWGALDLGEEEGPGMWMVKKGAGLSTADSKKYTGLWQRPGFKLASHKSLSFWNEASDWTRRLGRTLWATRFGSHQELSANPASDTGFESGLKSSDLSKLWFPQHLSIRAG